MISNTHDALRMANNTNLGAAKAAKNDEFYTQYADIQKEVNAYLEYNPDTFRDKVVLLPCDDPEWSQHSSRRRALGMMWIRHALRVRYLNLPVTLTAMVVLISTTWSGTTLRAMATSAVRRFANCAMKRI